MSFIYPNYADISPPSPNLYHHTTPAPRLHPYVVNLLTPPSSPSTTLIDIPPAAMLATVNSADPPVLNRVVRRRTSDTRLPTRSSCLHTSSHYLVPFTRLPSPHSSHHAQSLHQRRQEGESRRPGEEEANKEGERPEQAEAVSLRRASFSSRFSCRQTEREAVEGRDF